MSPNHKWDSSYIYESIMWSKAQGCSFRGKVILGEPIPRIYFFHRGIPQPLQPPNPHPTEKINLSVSIAWLKKKKHITWFFSCWKKKIYNLEPKPILEFLTLEISSKITNSFFKIINHGWIWVSSITTNSVFLMLKITFGDKGYAW